MIKCGIDIGGTNVKFGFFNDQKLFYEFHIKTPKNKEAFVKEIAEAIKEKKNSNLITHYVICVPGVIKNNIVELAPNCNITGLNLYEEFSAELNCKDILIDNDANLAALAEARATNTKDLVLITLGTGVGGGIVIDGNLYNKNGYAAEIGHVKIEFGPHARHCGCGRYGCAETYCSAKTMPLEYNLKHKTNLNSKQLFDLYEQNDIDAIKNVEHFARYLGVLISNINTILAINDFRIGGGLSLASDLFLDKVIKYYKMNNFDGLKDTCSITKASLSNHAGIYAAMYL
ncbi:MAG: ROK family protein [Acholeplasmatales bacterium]|nr:ROK family protein [Acholeplasmatales bacterium]